MAFSIDWRVKICDGRRSSLDHLDDPPAALLGDGHAARVGGGDVGAAGQGHAQRLGQAGHGAGGAHHHAVAVAAVHRALDLDKLLLGQPPGAAHIPEAEHIGARADLLAVPAALEHRPARDHDRRDIGAGRAHQLGRRGLIAAAQQHHAIDRVGLDHLLHVHGHQVAVEHGGGLDQHLAERDRGELQRQAAGLPDAALDRLGDDPQVGVAVGQLAPGVADADHRPAIEDIAREALRARPRAMDKGVERDAVEPVLAA